MTNIERKALELVNEVCRELGYPDKTDLHRQSFPIVDALCRAIEKHDAFRQEVSDAVERFYAVNMMPDIYTDTLGRFIIAKPDPLAKLIDSIAITLDADDLRAALDEAGLEIREKGK